ncbi:MAG TPA: hypothetical protein VHU80_18870 [Polyangiaceae bacterium]|jgi:hypothetical protein|nr:hypothetical protein [Polyangiaceae bacterium]
MTGDETTEMKADTSTLGTQATGATASTADEQPTTIGGEIVSGLLGVGIAVGCVLPPLVHLVTGPLGPFIGGFVAANRSHPSSRGRIIIAGMIGVGLAGIIAIAARVFVGLVGHGELPKWFPSSGTQLVIIGGAWVYGTAMGAAGTAVSTALARKDTSDRS